MKTIALLLLAAAFLFTACDKNKRASKKLMKAGNWEVVELSVDGQNISPLPSWEINDCDIYEELCTASWKLEDKQSQFYWQFNEKAKLFTISRIVAPEDCEDFYTEEVEQQTFKFSGDYEVVEDKRKTKTFESSKTLGYGGKKVAIRIEKN
ncbi:hypothetical protein [Brumimicrobium mesophilum]|uniref:hypothetical protein n=1 Tax=Brumimicrobium mesophilum TaxID=392717 RepID=UPI000D14325C|nr:hypothetical protein [Brumimicrobium mesophilum]